VCDIPQDLDKKASDICNDSTTSPLKINHFTSACHFDQSHAASASSMTKHIKIPVLLKINHFTSVRHFEQSHAATASLSHTAGSDQKRSDIPQILLILPVFYRIKINLRK
jgi:hypothetical protein